MNALQHAAPIQTRLAGHDYITVNPAGFITGHYKTFRMARANCPDGCRVSVWVLAG